MRRGRGFFRFDSACWRTWLCVAAVLTCPGTANALFAQPAPAMFRGGPAQQGVTDTRGLERLGGLAWRFGTGGPVRSSPTVVGGVVYFGSSDGHVYAVDAATGALRWFHDAGAPVGGAPLVTDTRVVFVDRANRIHAVRRDAGEPLWRVIGGPDLPLPWGREGWDYLMASPVLAGELVLAGTGDGNLYAVSLEDGAVRWRFGTGGRIRSAPAVHEGVAYVGAGDGIVYGVALNDGTEVWRFETEGHGLDAADWGFDRRQIYASPTIVDGVLYVGSRDASLYAVDLASGQPRWTFKDGTTGWIMASPAVSQGRVFSARSSGGRVRAVDLEAGTELWVFQTGGFVYSSPAVVGSTMYVGGGDGHIYAFDAATGDRRWTYRTGRGVFSTPAVWEGRLFVGSDDGFLYALEGTDGPAPRTAVFWDESMMSRAVWGANETHERVVEYFRERGYEALDSAGLEGFLAERLTDGAPSVVLIAMDAIPASVAQPNDQALLRRYLDRGGKVVWMGLPPLVVLRDENGQVTGVDRSRPTALLGVDHDGWDSDEYAVRITAAGHRWGLDTPWVGPASVGPDAAVTALAVDELGRAASWVKGYGGGPGTGFVFVRYGTEKAYLDELRRVVEYGILRAPVAASR